MNSVFQIENSALLKYTGDQETAEIPKGITKIGFSAFNSSAITDVVIPESVTSIGTSAFCWCTKLKSVSLPNGLKHINSSVFMGCHNLEKAILPNLLETIEEDAFEYCESLKQITIPGNVSLISESAFEGCKSLNEIVILSKDITIGKNAFKDIGINAIIKAPHCLISQFESFNKPSVVMGYLTMIEERTTIDDNVLESLKKYLKSQKIKYYQIAAVEPLLKKYLELWGIMPRQPESAKCDLHALVDLYAKDAGKTIATDLLIIASAFGDSSDIEYVINKFGKKRLVDNGIGASIYFAGAMANPDKLLTFVKNWNECTDTIFDAVFARYYKLDLYWMDYHFFYASRALDFYRLQLNNDENWPTIDDITHENRMECAARIMKQGYYPSAKSLSFYYADGQFDVYELVHKFGIDIDIRLFDYIFNPKARDPKTNLSYGYMFYQSLQRIDNQQEAKKQLEHIVVMLEQEAIKPIITNDMIKNGVVEYLFSPELREFTLSHYDLSNISKASQKRLLAK